MHGDLFYLPALSVAERARSVNKSHGHLYPVGPPAAAVRRQRGRRADQGQAFLLPDLRWLAQGVPDRLHQHAFPTPAARTRLSRGRLQPRCARPPTTFWRNRWGAYPRTGVNDIAFGKLDYQLNSQNHLARRSTRTIFTPRTPTTPATTSNNSSVTANGRSSPTTRIFVGNWDPRINNSMVNNFRFQWGLDNEITAPMRRPQRQHHEPDGLRDAERSAAPGVSRTSTGCSSPTRFRGRTASTRLRPAWTLTIHEVLINLFQGGGVYSYTAAQRVQQLGGRCTRHDAGRWAHRPHFSSFAQVTDPITGIGKDDFYDNDFAGFIEDSWKLTRNSRSTSACATRSR